LTQPANLFAGIPAVLSEEVIEPLVQAGSFRLERIVSAGQATPPGLWYDQARDEWVILLTGSAGLLFESESAPLVLHPGDHVVIPAHRRHRVEWTDSTEKTIWLALHYLAE
jgi:cupin 2 domain-containing protein